MAIDLKLYYENPHPAMQVYMTKNYLEFLEKIGAYLQPSYLTNYDYFKNNEIYFHISTYQLGCFFRGFKNPTNKYEIIWNSLCYTPHSRDNLAIVNETKATANQISMGHSFEVPKNVLALYSVTIPGFTLPDEVDYAAYRSRRFGA